MHQEVLEYLPYISLGLLAVTFLIGFACLWRTQQHLATFIKLCLVTGLFVGTRMVWVLLGGQSDNNVVKVLELGAATFALIASVEMLYIIKRLDGE